MTKYSKTVLGLMCGSLLFLAGCASTKPVAYSNLASVAQLQPNSKEDADRTPYVYTTPVSWDRYSSIVIDPTEVYNGSDNQFDGLPEPDKKELAQYMDGEFKKVLGKKFRISDRAEPNALRLKLTLTGASTNTAVVSTVTRFDLVGGPYNIVQSVRGKEGMFIGSVSYSVEIYDAASNRLLKAYVTKQYPNAMNVGASFGKLGASKTGIEKGATELLAELK